MITITFCFQTISILFLLKYWLLTIPFIKPQEKQTAAQAYNM